MMSVPVCVFNWCCTVVIGDLCFFFFCAFEHKFDKCFCSENLHVHFLTFLQKSMCKEPLESKVCV